MRRPTLPGHAIRVTRHEAYGFRTTADYTAVCECGAWSAPWADRMTVIRDKHVEHLRKVRAAQQPKPETST